MRTGRSLRRVTKLMEAVFEADDIFVFQSFLLAFVPAAVVWGLYVASWFVLRIRCPASTFCILFSTLVALVFICFSLFSYNEGIISVKRGAL